MSHRASLFAWLLSVLVVVVIVATGCGRSNLDVEQIPTDGGLDGDVGGCNAASCPTGCCDAGGHCAAGTANSACGTQGQQCTVCSGGSTCDAQARACTTVGRCGPASCPNGCCDNSGACRSGADVQLCGKQGQACQNCITSGFDTCDANTHVCETLLKMCDASTCPNGCCQAPTPMGTFCVSGKDNAQCGNNGLACANCLGMGEVCDPTQQTCVQPQCGPQNCMGCCLGDTCVPGNSQFACGIAGKQCFNCGPNSTCSGGSCVTSTCGPGNCMGCCDANGQCQPGTGSNACGQGGQKCNACPPNSTCQFGFCQMQNCNPMNCPGCCQGNTCVAGVDNMACGQFGQACKNCSAMMDTCQMGVCAPPPVCNTTTCPGCCDTSSICHGGFTDNRCGSGGVACVDCTQNNDTCDTQVTPRVCTMQQTTCPAPYPACPAGTTTVPPANQHVCPATDLMDAAAACTNGALSASCQAFFTTEAQIHPACAACLKPFDVRFFAGTGIFLCVAPFVDSNCNMATGCATDCEVKSCNMCMPPDVQACQTNVEQNQCSQYFMNIQCIFGAIMGPASFCNPQMYGGDFGGWLQGVGTQYCQ